MARILVTPRSLTQDPPRELSILTEAGHELVFSTPGKLPGEEELIELLPGCTGWLAGIEPVSPRVIAAADTLKAVSRNGTGVDNLPLADLERKGVRVLRAEGANATGVAELAVALMLAVLRGIPAADHGIKAGGWPRQRGKEMRGRVVGVVGCGAVGRQVALMPSQAQTRRSNNNKPQITLRVTSRQLLRLESLDRIVSVPRTRTVHPHVTSQQAQLQLMPSRHSVRPASASGSPGLIPARDIAIG